MSCHLVVSDMGRARGILESARAAMKSDFGLDHTTIQVEDQALRDQEAERAI